MIPITKPSITLVEKGYVNDALDSGYIGVGPYIETFERAWSMKNAYGYGVACSSGTAALFLALKALGVGPGDEVIVPEFTMISCAWAVTWTGATPVFVNPGHDLNIDVEEMVGKINKKTKAIMLVAIYGRSVSQRAFDLARFYNIPVVEDLAEGHGISPRGDIVCYSFYGNKILTTGEGGMCLTNNVAMADEMKLLRNLSFNKDRSMIHEKMGYNYRLTNLQAAIGVIQVDRVDELLHKRAQVAKWYDELIDERFKMPRRDVNWVYDIQLKDIMDENDLKEKLFEKGIESRHFFRFMSDQPMYRESGRMINSYKFGLYLPLYPDLTQEEVEYICSTINEISHGTTT